MKSQKRILALLLFLLILFSCEDNSNGTLKKELDRLGYSYIVDEQGDFRLTLNEGDPEQVLWIYGFTYYSGDTALRELFSTVHLEKDFYNPLLYEQLLQDNYQSENWGNWGLVIEKEEKLLVYRIQLPEKYLPALLEDAIKEIILLRGEVESQFKKE